MARTPPIACSPAEIDQRMLRALAHADPGGLDAADLALRSGCSAAKAHRHLARLEREHLAHRRDTETGPRWTAH